SISVLDRTDQTIAVAARSPADERSLQAEGPEIETLELRVADTLVGRLRIRLRSEPSPALLRLVITLVASEVERLRAPDRASEAAAASFLCAVLGREITDREELLARGRALGLADIERGGSILVARARSLVPTEEGWRSRLRQVAERGARGAAPSAVAVLWARDAM